jgi:hypothetical protein
MARGSENNILFPPPRVRAREGLHEKTDFSDEIVEKAHRVYEEMRRGDYYNFLAAVGSKRRDLADYTFFRIIFSTIAVNEINDDKILSDNNFRLSTKDTHPEVTALHDHRVSFIQKIIEEKLFQDRPYEEKKLFLDQLMKGGEGLFFASLLSENEGLLQEHAEKLIPLREEPSFFEMLHILEAKHKDLWEEYMKRQLLSYALEESPGRGLIPPLSYGIVRQKSRKHKAQVLHIIEKGRETLCGKTINSGLSKYIKHGFWRDGQITGESKPCPSCKSKASTALLDSVEEDKFSDLSSYFGRQMQGVVDDLARNDELRREAKKMLLNGSSASEIRTMFEEKTRRKLAKALRVAADSDTSSYRLLRGGHILWSSFSHSDEVEIEKAGVDLRPHAFASSERFMKEKDFLLEITTEKEREEFFYLFLKAGTETRVSHGLQGLGTRDRAFSLIKDALARFLSS